MALIKQPKGTTITIQSLVAEMTEKQLATARILYTQRTKGQKSSVKFICDLLIEVRDNS